MQGQAHTIGWLDFSDEKTFHPHHSGEGLWIRESSKREGKQQPQGRFFREWTAKRKLGSKREREKARLGEELTAVKKRKQERKERIRLTAKKKQRID